MTAEGRQSGPTTPHQVPKSDAPILAEPRAHDSTSPAQTADADNPGVRLPPPLIYGAGLLVGLGLQLTYPLPVLPEVAGVVLGAFLSMTAGLLAVSSIALFRRAGTTLDPAAAATTLVVSGPYRVTRNPIYLGLGLLYAAVAIWSGVTWALLTLPVVLVVVDRVVIVSEERYLERALGDRYRLYKSRVRRWL